MTEWPTIDLGEDADRQGYIHPDNVKLLLDQTENALKSQIEGVRQIFSRLGTILTQASALTSVSSGATLWLLTHPVSDRPAWISWTCALAALFWTLSGAVAVVGMRGAKFAGHGIHPEDGYKQIVLEQSVRDMQLWMIATLAGSLKDGREASDRLRDYLNASIMGLVAAPVAAFATALLVSLIL